eukprot:NODE_4409_length_1895_cov_5.630090.p1 GENE.NODE_4409_length_1895_cov_5.630090~~NODE_4409_length_1895_cov_5.630090.p1  ORF type:complete len:612 (-),score=109.18 NODE_4409_length_1895_cov_5.630090:59-1741(-)
MLATTPEPEPVQVPQEPSRTPIPRRIPKRIAGYKPSILPLLCPRGIIPKGIGGNCLRPSPKILDHEDEPGGHLPERSPRSPSFAKKEIQNKTTNEDRKAYPVSSDNIDLTGTKSTFTLTATIKVNPSPATDPSEDPDSVPPPPSSYFILGKLPVEAPADNGGADVARDGDGSLSQDLPLGAKVLSLKDGYLHWDIGGSTGIRSEQRLDDGEEHTVGVKFGNENGVGKPGEDAKYTLLIDGKAVASGPGAVNDPGEGCALFTALTDGTERAVKWLNMAPLAGMVDNLRWNGRVVLQDETSTNTRDNVKEDAIEEVHEQGDAEPPAEEDVVEVEEKDKAFETGDAVEYYSATHRCWLPGIVMRPEPEDPIWKPDEELWMSYRVLVLGKQLRQEVSVMNLRRPLEPDEPCYCFTSFKTWREAYVDERQPRKEPRNGATRRAYEVNNGNLVKNILTGYLLRRFEKNEKVEAHLGEMSGWVQAKVLEDNFFEWGMEFVNLSVYRDRDHSDGKAYRASSIAQNKWRSHKASLPVNGDPPMVPLHFPELDEAVFFPCFLVRRQEFQL